MPLVRIRVLQTGRHRLNLRADGTRMSDAVAREILVSEAGQERNAADSDEEEAVDEESSGVQ